MSVVDRSQPTSFRFVEDVMDAIDAGANRFGMSRTDWLSFLAKAAVSDKKSFLAKDNSEITITPKRRT